MKQQSLAKLVGYDHVVKMCELSGFRLTEGVYPPGLRQPRHTHEIAHISFIFRGSYTERRFLGRDSECKTSTLIFHPFDLTHSLDFDHAEARIFTVEIKPRWLEYAGDKPGVLNRPAYLRGGSPVWLAKRLLGEFRRGGAASALALEGLVLEMIAAAEEDGENKRGAKNARWLDQTLDFLRAEFAKNLTLEEIAKRAGVHPTHLARAFRGKTGHSVGEYVRRLRVEFAARRLASGDAPLGEIAAAAGFADQSHFSRTFKHYLGVTPGEYRKITRPR